MLPLGGNYAQSVLGNSPINMRLDVGGPLQRLQLNEQEEIRNYAYENSQISKAKIKSVHDQYILRKSFDVG